MRIVSIIGHKNAGKTTLLVALAREFHRRGKRVATIKQAAKQPDLDREGSDSWRFAHEGMADGVLIASPGYRALIERRPYDPDPVALAKHYFADRDLVLAEGFETSALPKIEIFRSSTGPAPMISAAADASSWLAVLTDSKIVGVTCPVLKFNDTMWLQLLATLAWDRGRVLDG